MKKGPVTIWTNLTQILTVEITQCPVIWNSLTIWVPAKGLNHVFSSVFFYSRYSMSSTPSLAPLHCWCSWGGQPMVLASSKHWALLLRRGCTFTCSLLEILLVLPGLSFLAPPLQSWPTESAHSPLASTGLSQCPALLVLHDPFMPPKSVPLQWLSHHQVQWPARSVTSASSES